MLRLKNSTGHENDDLVHDIEQHSGNYAPPVFFALADMLYRQGDMDDAIFWFNAGRLRASYDAARCADVSARDAVSVLVLETPVQLREAQFADTDKLKSIVQRVIAWDIVTPHRYEYRWINLHGMNAMMSGMGQSQANALPLSEPESAWPELEKKNRDDYEAALKSAVAGMEQRRAEGIVPGASTNSVYNVSPPMAETDPATGTPGMALKQTINFGGVGFGFGVRYLAFSPDARYLAVLGNLDSGHSVLIIWDVISGREQSRISDIGPFGDAIRNPLIWAPDDSYITLATGRRKVPSDRSSPTQIALWNPLTGEKIRDVEVSGGYGGLSLDGAHLAMVSGTRDHIVIRVYDTGSWASKDYSTDGLMLALGSLCWTTDGKIIVVGTWDRRFPLPGLSQLKSGDVLAREIDPSGQEASKTILLAPSQPAPSPSKQFVSSLTPLRKAVDNRGNKVAVGEGAITVFDGDSLQVLFSYTPTNLAQGAFGEIAFSPDGKYLYIMDARTVGHGQGLILDAQTGKQLGSFPSGTAGFSVSSDGRLAALGDEGAVKLFNLSGSTSSAVLSPSSARIAEAAASPPPSAPLAPAAIAPVPPAISTTNVAPPANLSDTFVNRTLGLSRPNRPEPREEIIRLGHADNFQVKALAFSPDGKYLAIFGSLDAPLQMLVIWDFEAKREIARITDMAAGFDKNPRLAILWAHDDSFITLGRSFNDHPNDPASPWQMRLWNPLTGTKIRDVDVQAWYAALNRDGTKLLTAAGSRNRAAFRIYDTHTWMYREYPGNEILYAKGTLAWTPQDHVFAAGPWYGRPVLPDLQPSDVLARLIDPSGQEMAQTISLASSKAATSSISGGMGAFDPRYSAVDDAGDKIAVGWGTIKVLSGDPFRVLYTYSPPKIAGVAEGRFNFSPDGKYLFIMSTRSATQADSVILDAQTGRQVGKFPTGTAGIAVSPDGHWLAIGDEDATKILAVPFN